MFDKEQDLDNQLADLTDALLSERPVKASDELQNLDAITRQLYELISPNTPPDPQFRNRLTQRLNEEWDAIQRETQPRRPSLVLSRRFLYAAALLVVIIGAGILVLSTSQTGPLQGTALNPSLPTGYVVVAIVGLAAVVAAIFFFRRKD